MDIAKVLRTLSRQCNINGLAVSAMVDVLQSDDSENKRHFEIRCLSEESQSLLEIANILETVADRLQS